MRASTSVLAALLLLGCRDQPPAEAPAPKPAPDAVVSAVTPTPALTRPERRVRPAAVAGSWYPGDAAELGRLVDGLLALALPPSPPGPEPLRALILPHAGYRYSGLGAAAGVSLLRGTPIRRVVVLGPAHRASLRGLSIADVTHYATPLGEIPLDLDAIARLRKSSRITTLASAHREEHSIEMQLPLLQRALRPGWKLVPVLVGHLDAKGFADAAELLRPLADGSTVFIASGDFTHYGQNYGYVPFPPDAQVAAKLRELDLGALAALTARDPAAWIAYRQKTGITACGFGPVAILRGLVGEDARATLLRYSTSGEVVGDYTHSVSYLSIAFTAERPLALPRAADALPPDDLRLLHGLARRALTVAVKEGARAVDADALVAGLQLDPRLREPSGVFVTLKDRGRLRGCIGYIEPRGPLYRAVVENAVNAALNDGRFQPVQPAELPGLDVEVSVLSATRPIPSPDEFVLGGHGIIVSKRGRRAVFLPEVAVEQGWDTPTTLTHLSQKAGLPPDAWRSGARFEVFTTQIFEAPFAP